MSTEIPNQLNDIIQRWSNAAPEASNLSHAVLSDPQDYLSTLQSVLAKANPRDPDNVTKEELIAYSKHGDNTRDEAAAAFGAKHFDQLRQMPTTFTADYNIPGATGLNRKEVGIDLDMVTGNLDSRVLEHRELDAKNGIPWAVASIAALAGASASGEVPPLAIGLTGAALVTGIKAEFYMGDALFVQTQAEEQSATDRRVLASWPEFNRELHGTK